MGTTHGETCQQAPRLALEKGLLSSPRTNEAMQGHGDPVEIRKKSRAPCTACSKASHAAEIKNLRRYRSSRKTREDASLLRALWLAAAWGDHFQQKPAGEASGWRSYWHSVPALNLHQPTPGARAHVRRWRARYKPEWTRKLRFSLPGTRCIVCLECQGEMLSRFEGTAANSYGQLQPPHLWIAKHCASTGCLLFLLPIAGTEKSMHSVSQSLLTGNNTPGIH